MLEAESAICDALNEAGTLATGNFLHRFDTDGSPIVVGRSQANEQGNCRQGVPNTLRCGDRIKARLPKP